ncbi:hypothetical protein [Steroidobacter agaridevorans]|nr:hypothetical protein [Steroidobacter agaridevorans]
MTRTSLIGTKHASTQSEVAACSSKNIGHSLFKGLFMATVAATMFCTNARAAVCEGPIAAVGVHDEGQLVVRQGTLDSPIWEICNIDDSAGYEANVATCKGWLAMLISAQKAGATVHLYTRSTACNLADWGIADVYFIEDRG